MERASWEARQQEGQLQGRREPAVALRQPHRAGAKVQGRRPSQRRPRRPLRCRSMHISLLFTAADSAAINQHEPEKKRTYPSLSLQCTHTLQGLTHLAGFSASSSRAGCTTSAAPTGRTPRSTAATGRSCPRGARRTATLQP